MSPSPLDRAVPLTDLAAPPRVGELRHHARRTGLIALRHALTTPDLRQRDTTVAETVRRSGLDGYGWLLAVSEVSRVAICCRHCIDRRLRLSDASIERGRTWIEAVLDSDQRMIRALAPRHRRADVREGEAYLLAACALEALTRIADPALLVRSIERELEMARAAARAGIEPAWRYRPRGGRRRRGV